jgi:hypothetical protein
MHLPVMLMWQVPATTVVFRMPGHALPNPVPPGAVVADAFNARIDPKKFETPK